MDTSSTYFPPLASVGDVVFKQLEAASLQRTSNEQVGELLASLAHIYGRNLNKALQIVDKGGVVCYQGESSGRTLFLVQGSAAADHYLVFPRHYCTCQSFFYDVVSKSEAVCCKHQLAARLASALGKCKPQPVSEVTIAEALVNS